MPTVDQGARYAIYFVPAAGSPLYRYGSSVLGYDCYTGDRVPPPDEIEMGFADWGQLTEQPRRYGFHATLKAPFRLLPDCPEERLVSALASFAGLGHIVATIQPAIEMLGDFAAIVSREPQPKIDALAVNCTTIFDAFRAPMSARERARRVAAGLSRSQIENLDRWGYPYLFSDFRFHMSLTGPLATGRREIVDALQRAFRRICGNEPIAIDRLALMRQESAQAAFRVVSVAALNGGA
jgi:hypothetical protein